MADTVLIDERFNGPPGTANGGYTAALVARTIGGPAEVTLRSPPPLGRELRVEGHALYDGETLLAEARPAEVALDVPAPVSLAEARTAAARYPWRDRHPYPTCFVCGPRREHDDGLGIYPGPVDGRALYAAAWTPEGADDVYVWGALDCPSGIVTDLLEGEVGRILLGRLTADVRRPVVAGEPHVVQAWPLERDGRKLHTASALFSAGGELCAVGRAVWIEVAPK